MSPWTVSEKTGEMENPSVNFTTLKVKKRIIFQSFLSPGENFARDARCSTS